MITSWVLYSLLVGAAVAVAARGLAGVLGPAGVPTRWVWAAGLAAALALPATAPYRVAAPAAEIRVVRVAEEAAAGGPAEATLLARWGGVLRSALREATDVPLRRLARASASWSAPERALGGAWAVMSAALLLAFTGTSLRHRAVRRRSPVARLQGTEVRVAADLGPAVAGLLRPEIVVPRWLLSSPPEEQSLVLAHEEEHRRAGDPLLLAGACLAVVLLPWHPAVWWMASRLRLATEIDCDARVLRRGARPLAYGSLLIDIAGRCAGSLPGVPAIAGSRSHLERRLHAMIPRNRRFGLLRGGALGALAVVATLAACEASMPTAADVARMDVSTAERGAKRLALLPVQVNAEYFIDGQSATAEQAHALAPERIEAMQVLKRRVKVDASSPAAEQGTSQIRILTKDAPESVRAAFERERPGIYHRADTMVYVLPDLERSSSPIVAEPEAPAGESHMKIRSTDGGPAPLLFIDGVRSAPEAMSKLPPARIQKVEVLKGPAATKLYGSEGAGGVIRITTNER